MKERIYTVAEIDRMRAAVEYHWLFGRRIKDPLPQGGVNSRVSNEEERTKCVEVRLRTYMLAGIDPADLEHSETSNEENDND